MLYRPFGKTGKEVSAVSFGGMRFPQPDNLDSSAELILYAHRQGINYIDTAPVYCDDRSEEIVGHALTQLPREQIIVSSKSGKSDADELRKNLERSLERLRTDHIDIYYIWHLMNKEDWEKRQLGGAVEAALRAREEGLIGHLFCSSHMPGDGLAEVLKKGIFEGVLLGYNALNFPYRRAAIEQAGEMEIGVATMNPLAGGLIPQNAERFSFLKSSPDESIVSAALRFNLSHPAISTALVGFSSISEIDQAVAAVEHFTPLTEAQQQQLSPNINPDFDALCTGCNYCLPCPVNIRIPAFMDTYNQVLLNPGVNDTAAKRLKFHWRLAADQVTDCTACGACEKRCTQHLPIIERLKELAPKK